MNYRLADCAFYAALFWIYFLANRTVGYKVGEIRIVWNKAGAVWFQEVKKLGIGQIIEGYISFLKHWQNQGSLLPSWESILYSNDERPAHFWWIHLSHTEQKTVFWP